VFRKLKKVFITELVLAIPDLDKKIRVEANASDYATGGVLLVKCENKKWRPVAFISKSLASNNLVLGIVEALLGRDKSKVQNLDGS